MRKINSKVSQLPLTTLFYCNLHIISWTHVLLFTVYSAKHFGSVLVILIHYCNEADLTLFVWGNQTGSVCLY